MEDIALCKTKNFGNISYIYLMLGPACNMSCRHCAQGLMKDKCSVFTDDISEDVWNLLDNYVGFCKKSYKNDKVTRYIGLWGGEPLLHWKAIKEIIERITLKFNILEDDSIRFTMTTNGLLFTEDKIDFLNKFGVHVTFSYDAPHPFAVRGFVSKEICKLVRKINWLEISACCCAYNDDPLFTHQCLEAMFPEAKHILVAHTVFRAYNMPSDIYTYNFDSLRKNIRRIRIAAQLNDKFAVRFIWDNYLKLIQRSFDNKKEQYRREENCSSVVSRLAISLDGKIFNCYNSSDIVGSIYESKDVVRKRIVSNVLSLPVSAECNGCKHKYFCLLGSTPCPYYLRNKDGSLLVCKDYFIPFFDILEDECLKLNEPLSDEDKMWYENEIKSKRIELNQFLSKYA